MDDLCRHFIVLRDHNTINCFVREHRLTKVLAFHAGVGNGFCNKADRANGVIVAGNYIVNRIGVTVRVGKCHNRNLQSARFIYRQMLFTWIDNEYGFRQLGHTTHTGKVLENSGALTLQSKNLFLD